MNLMPLVFSAPPKAWVSSSISSGSRNAVISGVAHRVPLDALPHRQRVGQGAGDGAHGIIVPSCSGRVVACASQAGEGEEDVIEVRVVDGKRVDGDRVVLDPVERGFEERALPSPGICRVSASRLGCASRRARAAASGPAPGPRTAG